MSFVRKSRSALTMIPPSISVQEATQRVHPSPRSALDADTNLLKSPMSSHALGSSICHSIGRSAVTQAEQDMVDDETRHKAMADLVQSWLDRLQLISVITTFFASMEASVLGMTTPVSPLSTSPVLMAANAGLLGALVFHVYAAILSFLAAFLLVRYKLSEATKEELRIEGVEVKTPAHAVAGNTDIERQACSHVPEQKDIPPTSRNSSPELAIFSTNPHIEQVGPFRFAAPTHLLSRFHSLCVLLASLGFMLAVIGILLYAWALHKREVSAFATACLGASIIAGVVLLL